MMTTPEYLPPEVLQYLETKSEKDLVPILRGKSWSIDIWSFGIILLEIVLGFPVYMAYKGRIVGRGVTSSI